MRIALAPLAALLALAGCDRQGPAPQPGNVGDAVTVRVGGAELGGGSGRGALLKVHGSSVPKHDRSR